MAEDLIDELGDASDDGAATTQSGADDATETAAGDQEEKSSGQDSKDDLSSVPSGDLLSDDETSGESDGETSYELEVPEELEAVAYSEEALSAFQSLAKDLGLTQEQFQKLAEYDMRNAQAAQSAAVEAWQQRVQVWKEDVLKDPDFGGERIKETMANIRGVLDRFGDKEFRSILLSPSEDNPDGLAIGNHPAFVRVFNRIGKALADPSFEDGSSAQPHEDMLKKLYPSMHDKE